MTTQQTKWENQFWNLSPETAKRLRTELATYQELTQRAPGQGRAQPVAHGNIGAGRSWAWTESH
jgi:hypothetical protein